MRVVGSSRFQALERGTKNQILMTSVSFRVKTDFKGRQKRKVSVGHISVLERVSLYNSHTTVFITEVLGPRKKTN